MKTSELMGAALDWAVAKCEGLDGAYPYSYSTNWIFGGPLIEREKIGIWPSASNAHNGKWCARMIDTYITYSPTPLIAAMRCYVASKMGDEVTIPEELL